jgi:hypothetical protein
MEAPDRQALPEPINRTCSPPAENARVFEAKNCLRAQSLVPHPIKFSYAKMR